MLRSKVPPARRHMSFHRHPGQRVPAGPDSGMLDRRMNRVYEELVRTGVVVRPEA
jgi:hypothetical protein